MPNGDPTIEVVMPQTLVTLPDVESVAWAVKEAAPALVGVPVMAPEEAFRFRPAGNDPVNENVKGGVPPDAVSAEL